MTITGGIGETGGMKGTKDGNNKKAGARFGVPLILLSTAKSHQMGAVKPVKLKWNAVMLSKAGGGLKPSGDFVCFGWHGDNMICGGPVYHMHVACMVCFYLHRPEATVACRVC